jgi:hypothetical protein
MSKSPLEGSFSNSGRRPLPKWTILVGVLALAGLGGGVLAANISIGAGAPIEFGQGSANAIACDTSITVTPNSTFNGTIFTVSSIVLADVLQTSGTTTDGGCGGENIVVKVHNSTSPLASATASISASSGATGSFTVSPSPAVTANDVYKITLESID